MDEDELDLLRDDQDATVDDLAYAYPSIAELVAAQPEVAPMHDPGRAHELACRLIADALFEEHRDHIDAISSARVLDQVGTVVGKLTGQEPAQRAADSLRDQTIPALRAQIHDPADEDGTRERELRDAATLVLAADALARVALD